MPRRHNCFFYDALSVRSSPANQPPARLTTLTRAQNKRYWNATKIPPGNKNIVGNGNNVQCHSLTAYIYHPYHIVMFSICKELFKDCIWKYTNQKYSRAICKVYLCFVDPPLGAIESIWFLGLIISASMSLNPCDLHWFFSTNVFAIKTNFVWF